MSKTLFYDFNIDKIKDEIIRRNPKRVLIQLPDGLKKHFLSYLEDLKKTFKNVDFYMSGDPAYGGCFLAENEAEILKADLIIHIGHTKYYEPRIPTIFVEAFSTATPSKEIIKRLAMHLKNKRYLNIGLCATVQHVNILSTVKKLLENRNIKVLIGKKSGFIKYDGQVIGCNYNVSLSINQYVDAHVIISGGYFHPIGLGLATLKPIIKLDPYENKFIDLTNEIWKILKKRYGVIMKALNAKKFAIIMGLRKGQFRKLLIENLIRKLSEKNAKYNLVVLDEISLDKLRNIDAPEVNAYIITSCPRIPIDDIYHFEKPVLTPGEAFMILENNIEKYRFPW